MKKRSEMGSEDWLMVPFNLAIGGFLGLAGHGMAQLWGTIFWPVAVGIVLMFAAVIIFDGLFQRLMEWIFPSFISRARTDTPRGRKPLLRVLSFPAGLVLGVLAAVLGYRDVILGML